jgi:RNA polymerase sigma factor (sigma-70 family)
MPPPPPADESAQVARAKAGDPAAVAALLARVEDFVAFHATRLRSLYPAADPADVAQEGRIAVARCVAPFELGRVRWITYAGTAALRAMHEYAERAAREAERFPADPDAERADPDLHPAPARPDHFARLDPLLAALDPARREALEIWFGVGRRGGGTYADVARRMGVSVRRATALVRTALARLRGLAAAGDTIE